MAREWRYSAARIVPEPIGRLPYRAALAAARAIASDAEIWARNSYAEREALVPLVSDLDLTVFYDALPESATLSRLFARFGALKRAMPWLGELNVYSRGDLGWLAPLLNRHELARDAELGRRILAQGLSPSSSCPPEAQASVFFLRMLDADLTQVCSRPELRERKWSSHWRRVGASRPGQGSLLEQIIETTVALAALGSPDASAQASESLKRYFAERLRGKPVLELRPQIDETWRAFLIHRFCFEPGAPIPAGPLAEVAWAQLSWEICGLASQPSMLLGTPESRETLARHLGYLEGQLRSSLDPAGTDPRSHECLRALAILSSRIRREK